MRAKDLPQPEPVSPFQHLDERKAAIYENLRDLQFEYRVGKLSDQDYQQTKLDLQRELAGGDGGDRPREGRDRRRKNSSARAGAGEDCHGAEGLRKIRLPVLQGGICAAAQVLRRVRKADEGGGSMMGFGIRTLRFVANRGLVAATSGLRACAFGAIDGTVVNQTIGQAAAWRHRHSLQT